MTALDVILGDRIEGGYSNHPKDRGGPTNRGVSLRAVRALDFDKRLPAFLKDEFDVNDDGVIDGDDVPGWTYDTAVKFYERFYWQAISADELPWPLSLLVFDSAVNEGVGTAIRHLQRTVRVPDDGVIGPQTRAAAHRYAHEAGELLLRQYSVNRLDRYRKLDEVETFFRGWTGRVLDTYVEALKEAA
jgi:lysozyme family protein